MKRFLVGLILLAACGKDVTAPVEDPFVLPFPQFKNDGLLRFTLADNCPAMTVLLGVDIFWYGPVSLQPGESKDYQQPAATYVTSGKTYPTPSRTFPSENTVVTAGKRTARVLSC